MFWLWVFLAVLFLFAAYLFFAPFSLEVSSVRRLFRLRLFHLAFARLILSEESLFVEITAVGLKKKFDLLTPRRRREKKKKISRRSKFKPPLRKIVSVLQSFRVKGYADVDTGSMPLNGILYPAAVCLRMRAGWPVCINFRDEQQVELEIRNSMARMVWAYVSS